MLYQILYPFTIYNIAQPSSEESEEVSSGPVTYPNVLIAVFGGSFIVAALVVVTTCRKLKRETKQKRLALETARDVIETYWSKKITIEKPHINTSHEATGALVSLF